MTIVALIYLVVIKMFNPALVILIVIRDLIVDGSRVIMAQNKIEIQASKLAKIKTFYLSIIIIIALLLASIYQGINAQMMTTKMMTTKTSYDAERIPEFSISGYAKLISFKE